MVKSALLTEPVVEVLEPPTEAAELERAKARRARYDLNWTWFQSQVVSLGHQNRGRYVCVACSHAYPADTAAAAVSAATAAHPEDDGRFVYYFPPHELPRIHAHTG